MDTSAERTSKTIAQLAAERITGLINSRPWTPTTDEIAAVIDEARREVFARLRADVILIDTAHDVHIKADPPIIAVSVPLPKVMSFGGTTIYIDEAEAAKAESRMAAQKKKSNPPEGTPVF